MASSPLAASFHRFRSTVPVSLPTLFTLGQKANPEDIYQLPGQWRLRSHPPTTQVSILLLMRPPKMLRVKDPKVSLDFYSRIMGMSLLKRFDFPELKFTLYFMGYEEASSAPSDPTERTAWTFGHKATLELTHNWGSETDADFKGYHNGNSEPHGFGHIGITVDNVHKACKRIESLGVEFVKRPDDGKVKDIAFLKDPDGYWIEIFDITTIAKITAAAAV